MMKKIRSGVLSSEANCTGVKSFLFITLLLMFFSVFYDERKIASSRLIYESKHERNYQDGIYLLAKVPSSDRLAASATPPLLLEATPVKRLLRSAGALSTT